MSTVTGGLGFIGSAFVDRLLRDHHAVKAKVKHIGDQKGDVPGTQVDVSRAQEVFGYAPSTSILEGIPKTVQWVRGQS